MSVPKPPISLDDSCSVIHGDTLYSYSSQGLVSITLEKEAKWATLKMGVKVKGATCVGLPDASLVVVGGRTDPNDDGYTGLQKYTYATDTWTTINNSPDLDMRNRQGHASVYIPADKKILVYAGSQDESLGLSSQTFSILASDNYDIRAFESPLPPTTSPILVNWSDADAAVVSGTTIWLFNPTAGWRDFGTSFDKPLEHAASTRAVLVNGNDGWKYLYVFDFSQLPNAVGRIPVQDAKGAPIHGSSMKTGWPEYNATFAPNVKRENPAVAQGSNGLVVFSGGNIDEPIAIFNVSSNGWVNTTALLGKKVEQQALVVSSTSSLSTSISTSSPSQTPASTTAAATTTTAAAAIPPAAIGQDNENSGPSSDTILGITLGSVAGVLALLGLILLWLRRRKRRRHDTEVGRTRRAGGTPSDEKDTAGFANSTPGAKSAGQPRGHYAQASQESYSSMAILMGRMGKDKAGLSRKLSHDTDTNRSSVSSLHKQFKSTISKPIPQTANHPSLVGQDDRGVAFAPTVGAPRPRNRNGAAEAQDGMRRSSGWNRYWSGGSALQILGFGAAKRSTTGSERSSRYSEVTNNNPTRVTQDSATVPPLNFENRPEVNSVVSGSPVVSQFTSNVRTEGMSGKIERPVSAASSGYSSGIPESIMDVWDATEAEKVWDAGKGTNSGYAPSYYYGVSSGVSSPTLAAAARPPPSGVSKQPQLAMAAKSSDMSWLNLGDQSRV